MERMRRGNSNGFQHALVRRELEDSLPLCHPNDDYLKDFQPMSRKFYYNIEKQMNFNYLNFFWFSHFFSPR